MRSHYENFKFFQLYTQWSGRTKHSSVVDFQWSEENDGLSVMNVWNITEPSTVHGKAWIFVWKHMTYKRYNSSIGTYLSATLPTLHLLFWDLGYCRSGCTGRLSICSVSNDSARSHNSETHLGFLNLLLLLLSLSFANGSQPCLIPNSSSLVPLRGNSGKIGPDNPPLVLHSTPRAFLGNFFSYTLLVQATIELCPGDLARVFTLQEERGIFGVGKTEDLR